MKHIVYYLMLIAKEEWDRAEYVLGSMKGLEILCSVAFTKMTVE